MSSNSQEIEVGLYLSSKILWNEDISSVIDSASDYGYSGLELWYEHFLHLGYLYPFQCGDLIGLLQNASLSLWLHGPIMDLNLTSVNPDIARVSLRENMNAVKMANRLEAEGVVIHPGHLSSSSDDEEKYWDDQLIALDKVARKADGLFTIENMDSGKYHFVQRPSDLQRILNHINLPNAGICCDTAHARSLGSLDDFLTEASDEIIHLHYSNSGKNTIHAPIDRGNSNITEEFMDFLGGFDGSLTFEGRDPRREHEVAKITKDEFSRSIC